MSLNVLKPDLVWLGNRCYRKIPVRQKPTVDEEDECPTVISNRFEEDDYDHVPMNSVSSKEFQTSVTVATVIFSKIKGQLKVITKDTNARLNPFQHNDSTEIVITGFNKISVGSAHERITILAEGLHLNSSFTHFISVPMNFPNLKRSFQTFKNEVLEKCAQAPGLSEDLFQNPSKLHLTITTLALLDSRDAEHAISILQNCRNTIRELLNGESLSVMVKGIEHMNDDPSEVDVLYAKINDREDSNFLQIIADKMLEAFTKEKLVVKQDSLSVKLHMTLMNTRFRSDSRTSTNDNVEGERITFDAREIFKHFPNYEFGVIEVPEIHLSIRYSKPDRTGYYKSVNVLKLV